MGAAEPALTAYVPPATYAEIEALPEHLTGEIIDEVLYVRPRPASPHARSTSRLGMSLGGPFDIGTGGPGGWIILDEPEVHFDRDVVVPDLAGWRRERLPVLEPTPWLSLTPDWICEVLSPSTASHDRIRKLRVYARNGVAYVWLVDPLAQTLEVYALDGEQYRVTPLGQDSDIVRAPPFDAVPLDLALLWAK
jgi:Uma2 family endonuclease